MCSLLGNSGVTVWPGGLILDPPVSPANHKMAITNNDPVKANGPGQPAAIQIALLKLGDSPDPEGGVRVWD